MAAADKTYTKSYKEYKEFLNWCEGKVFTCPNGDKFYPRYYCFDYWKESDFDGETYRPIINTPMELDYFLIKYCPIEWIQKTYEKDFGEYYTQIKEGKSEYDTFTKEGKYGTHVKMMSSPSIYNFRNCNTPYKSPKWWIQIDTRNAVMDGYCWYNDETNRWIWENELGIWNTNTCCKFKTIKSAIRHMRKWHLPKGTIVHVFCRYTQIEYIFKIY